MTVLRSREIISPPKTTPHRSKTRPKSNPSTPIDTSASKSVTSTPTSSHPQNPSPNPNLNPNPNSKSMDSTDSGGTRRRSLRLASKTPESTAAGVSFDLLGERVTVAGVEKSGSGSDPVTQLSDKGPGLGEEGETELGPSSDSRVCGEKKKRKLEIDINLPASECEEEEGESKLFLSLRSGKRVAKRGLDGGGVEGGDNNNGDETGRDEKGKGKGKLGEDGIDAEAISWSWNISPTVVKVEAVEEDSEEEEIVSGENVGRRKYSRQEKGKEPLVGGALNDNNVELELGLTVQNADPIVVEMVAPSPVPLQDEVRVRNNDDVGEDGGVRNRYMERFRDIARQNAIRFARFDPNEDGDNDVSPPQADVEQDVEDWPGPFSTAMRIMRDGAEKNAQMQNGFKNKTKPPSVNWVPKCQDGQVSKKVTPSSLQELCLSVLAINADAIVSLDSVPDALRHQLSHLLCDSRRMTTHFFELLTKGSPTEVRLRDCSWLTEEEFTVSFQQCDLSNLTVLQLDQCGRCMPDYILDSTLARSTNCLPALTSLSVSGACRLSDAGLAVLVSSAPALRSLNLSQCSLLTSSSIDALANSLGSVLRELYLTDCQSINAMRILPALIKFEHLEVLWLSGVDNVCDGFMKKFIAARGHNLKELVLTDCINLTDSSVKVIAETCSGLSALDLVKLHKLTDSSLGYLANGCKALKTLKLCRNRFSDEAIAAFLETSGECLKELSLNNVTKVDHNTAISLAKHSRSLYSLDLSWCRNLTDEALGLIVDSCQSLKMLKLFGCTQITDLFLCGHSNSEVKIIGVRMSPILKNIEMPYYTAAEAWDLVKLLSPCHASQAPLSFPKVYTFFTSFHFSNWF